LVCLHSPPITSQTAALFKRIVTAKSQGCGAGGRASPEISLTPAKNFRVGPLAARALVARQIHENEKDSAAASAGCHRESAYARVRIRPISAGVLCG